MPTSTVTGAEKIEIDTPNRLYVEGLGRSGLAIGTLNYERTLTDFYTLGIGVGFNPTEAIRTGSYYSSGVLTIPAYVLVTPWAGKLKPFFTGGFTFQLGIGKKTRKEPGTTFIHDLLVNQGGLHPFVDQGPVMTGGAGLEYRFVGDWLIRATGYGLYFMKGDYLSPFGGLSIGRQF
ncbi:hypothetical protein ACFLRA_03515 [Bdellovibrionota bacterium]